MNLQEFEVATNFGKSEAMVHMIRTQANRHAMLSG